MRDMFLTSCGVSAATALGFVWYGISTLYDNSYSAQIVGGDAYNFIIYATQGTAIVCGGIVFAIFSAMFGILAYLQTGAMKTGNASAPSN